MLDYFIMSQNQYFRAGTGCVIYNNEGSILIFARKDNPQIWQLQQGGQDAGESVTQTLWRELEEETALTETDFTNVDPYPNWTLYAYSESQRETINDQNCLGQTHRWFFLKLKTDTKINLSLASDDEFVEHKWCTFAELLAITDKLKYDIYKDLKTYFENQIIDR